MLKRSDAETAVNVFSTSIFCVFTFLYLFCFQNDLLAYAQYVLSDGTTIYNSLVGAFIITCILMLVSLLSAKTITKNLSSFPALFHLPSVLLLATITDIHVVENGQKNVFGYTWIISSLIFLVLLTINVLFKKISFIISSKNFLVFKNTCINLFILFAMLVFVVCSANTAEEDHIMLRCERLINNGEYNKASDILENCNVNNSELTILKAFALAKSNNLGDRFFKSLIMRGSNNLLPSNTIKLHMFNAQAIFKELGGIPSKGLSIRKYLEIMDKRRIISSIGKEYLLIACLMDRDLDSFVKHYINYYRYTNVSPKHYKEAFVLYSHMRSKPIIVLNFPEIEADYDDFKDIKKQYPDKTLCENALRDTYGNTYWFYYFFTASSAFTQSVSKEN